MLEPTLPVHCARKVVVSDIGESALTNRLGELGEDGGDQAFAMNAAKQEIKVANFVSVAGAIACVTGSNLARGKPCNRDIS